MSALNCQRASVGKIRRNAYRLHQAASKPQDKVCDLEDLPKPQFALQADVSFTTAAASIFKDIFIPPEALKQKLPTYSKKDETNLKVKSAIAENSLINSIRGRRRKIPFHEVVASAKDFLKKIKEEKKAKKTFVLNDLQALQAALPSLEEQGQEKIEKPRTSKPVAQQNAEMMEDLEAYNQCLSQPDFEADPFTAITNILTQHIMKS